MKKLIFVILLIAGLVCNTSGQAIKSVPDNSGKLSFQFGITDQFQVSNLNGTIAKVNYHFSDKSALRLSVGINYREDEGWFDDEDIYIDTKHGEYKFALQYIRRIHSNNDFLVFIASGPFYLRNETGSVPSMRKGTVFQQAGLLTVLGLEWFFRENMSLSVESGIQIYYQHDYKGQSPWFEENFRSVIVETNDTFNFSIALYL